MLYHGIKFSQYKAVIGIQAKIGLKSMLLPNSVKCKYWTLKKISRHLFFLFPQPWKMKKISENYFCRDEVGE